MITPGHLSESSTREHIWLVALYEYEARADELLERLTAIGVDTSEATTVRVEIDDQLRTARYSRTNSSLLSPISRNAITGALIGGSTLMLIGIALYLVDFLTLKIVEGLFNHAIIYVFVGAVIGAAMGALLTIGKRHKTSHSLPLPAQQLRSEGFLVAVKMPPPLAEQAEEIARRLGAKEILI